MAMAQAVSSMVLALRRKVNIKVRQPLQSIMVPVLSDDQRQAIEPVSELIKSEVNVKEIRFVGDSEGILVKRIKPDFKKLGPRYGKIMKALAATIAEMSQEQIGRLERKGSIELMVEGNAAVVERADVEIVSEDIPGWLVANEGALTVALDITVTDELRHEGLARELVNRVQNLRKQNGFEVSDHIALSVEHNEVMAPVLAAYRDYICREVQAEKLTEETSLPQGAELDMDDFVLRVEITKI